MWRGTVVSIHVTSGSQARMNSAAKVHAIAGKGLEGDRYFSRTGSFSQEPGLGREITLIEVEALEALKRDYGIELPPADSRRNIVTRGVPLNHLVGEKFKIGEVKLRGIRLCDPCYHLEKLTAKGVMRGLVHRGGLRADILTDGVICVKDNVEALCGSR
jgi:MOSC domain-containing protein YiiM